MLTTLREKPLEMAATAVHHARYVVSEMGEVAVP
jgi:hypothetical protein